MAASINVCEISEDVTTKLRKFRFRKAKTNAAVIMKIDLKAMVINIEEEHEDVTIEEVAEELPEFQPRYIAYSYCYEHKDGRISYPLVFIYYCPAGVKPETNMIYASERSHLVRAIDIGKVFEMRDAEDMTSEWLEEKLNFFG